MSTTPKNTNTRRQTLKLTEEKFFMMWLMIWQPFLNLRNREKKILAKFLYNRYLLSKTISNEDDINNLLFSSVIRKKMCTELKMGVHSFNNGILCLRKNKLLQEDKINHVIIPSTEVDFKKFTFSYDIEIEQVLSNEQKA